MAIFSEMSRFTCIEVFDNQTQAVVTASSILEEMAISEAHKMRMVVEEAKQKGRARYSCPLCGRTLSLRGGLHTSFVMHFAHPREPEHHCPYKTKDNHTPKELEAMKYNGLKETFAHRQVKARLLRGLRHDPGVTPGSLRSEKVFRANLPDKSWRRPDVAATWNSRNLVFEAQLATTFVTVIAERRNFYTENGAELVWVFAERPESEVMRFTVKDIFYNNNCNLFVVNNLTDTESTRQQKLVMEAWWPNPSTYERSGEITDWCSKLVSLEQLTFDTARRVVFFFDFDAAITEKELSEERAQIAHERVLRLPVTADDRVPPGTSFALSFSDSSATQIFYAPDGQERTIKKLISAISTKNTQTIWEILRHVVLGESRLDSFSVFIAFAANRHITVIGRSGENLRAFHFEAILSALFSLAAGTPIGNGYSNLKEVENWIYRSHTCHYVLFLHAVKAFKRESWLEVRVPNSAMARHVAEFRKASKSKDINTSSVAQDRSLDSIFKLTFPELVEPLEKLGRMPSST